VKLHLGCGKRYIPGFVHIDIAEFPHIDYSVGIDKLPMLANDSVDLIYCCHAFEYFDRTQAAAVLSEWCRVLKPGGILRLAVPNFEALIKVFAERGELELILGPLFGRIVVQTSQGAATLYHRTVYDYKSLERLLLQSGLRSVRRYNWRETIHKDYDDFSQAYIPHMDKDKGILVSLNVEAIK
jgi:predicted SAM-dependent methyltransferase